MYCFVEEKRKWKYFVSFYRRESEKKEESKTFLVLYLFGESEKKKRIYKITKITLTKCKYIE